MRFKWVVLILIIVVIAGVVIFKSVSNNNNSTNESEINSVISQPTEKYTYNWVVKSKFNYDRIERSGDELIAYVGEDSFVINPQTGEKTDKSPTGNRDIRDIYFYDYDSLVWGHRGALEDTILGESLDEEGFSENYYIPVQYCKVTGDNILSFTPAKFAVYSYNGFMTSFKFDNIEQKFVGTQIAVCSDNKWGFVSKNGVQMVDFIFDDAISISDGKSFVKEKDKWGIINIEKE